MFVARSVCTFLCFESHAVALPAVGYVDPLCARTIVCGSAVAQLASARTLATLPQLLLHLVQSLRLGMRLGDRIGAGPLWHTRLRAR